MLYDECKVLSNALEAADMRVYVDYRDHYSPGWKFNHWELKDVPIRVELGPKDLEKQQCVAVRRVDKEKSTVPLASAPQQLSARLDDIHNTMFANAKKDLEEHVAVVYTFEDFCAALDKKNVILAPFCGDPECEDKIKKHSARDAIVEEGAPAMGAKGLCIPFKQPKEISASDKCICTGCERKPKHYTMFGRSY
jgi:prolyl-tRNA synthetase